MTTNKELIHKSYPVLVTKVDQDKGVVDAIVSVMGNIDYGDDIIHNGAFTKTISERAGKVRVLDNHRSESTTDVVGKPILIKEIGKEELPASILNKYPDATGGLFTSTQFDMDDDKSKIIFNKIANGFIDEWSIGFTIPRGKSDHTTVKRDNKDAVVRNIREVILYEFSPVIFGMNDATTTVGTKELDVEKANSLMQVYWDITDAFESRFFNMDTYSGFVASDVYDDGTLIARAINLEVDYTYYRVNYFLDNDGNYNFDDMSNWLGGNFTFVAGLKELDIETETKAGRVLSQANFDKISKAHELLMEVVNSATPQEEMSNDINTEDKNNEYDIIEDNSNEDTSTLVKPENTPLTNEDKEALLNRIDELDKIINS